MWKAMSGVIGSALALGVGAGCGSSPLEDGDNVRTWATTGSAVAVYAHAYEPIAFADGQAPFADPACPVTTDDGTTVTVTGGCTASDGAEWIGTATVERSGDDRSLTLAGFGHFLDPGLRSETDGTVDLVSTGAGSHSFEADLVIEGGLTTTIRYSGTVEGGYEGATTWNGSGHVERDGLVSPTGNVRVTTTDEVIDDAVCEGQPASGETTIAGDGDTAFVRYDGATDCDAEHTARWGFDGEDRGSIADVYCAVTPGGAGRGGWAPVLLGAAVLGLARRRSRSSD